MKKILITGKNSYIGTSLENWLAKEPENYQVDTVDTRDGIWEEKDFSRYDVVFHVAGIAHNSADPKLEDLYYKVNRDLTVEIAKKAKQEKVSQFIFMSSMIVYGNNPNGRTRITSETKPKPDNFYGDSKLQAEIALRRLETDAFKIVILRPPMIYGKDSKGNYPLLSKFAQKSLIFPDYENKRSILHIDNFCEFVRLMIKNQEQGTFHPQNQEYMQTSEIVRLIGGFYKRRIWLTKLGNPLINSLFRINLIKKVFGDLYYDQSMSRYKDESYQLINLAESIALTER